MTSRVQWFPERLNATILTSFQASLAPVAADANANSPSSKAGATVEPTGPTSAELKPTGIGAVFEEGAAPHEIEPKKGYLYLKGRNVFVSVAVHHPGSAPKPYLRPAAARWAAGGYNATARGVMAGGGFR